LFMNVLFCLPVTLLASDVVIRFHCGDGIDPGRSRDEQ
jgi:hypothetical protein